MKIYKKKHKKVGSNAIYLGKRIRPENLFFLSLLTWPIHTHARTLLNIKVQRPRMKRMNETDDLKLGKEAETQVKLVYGRGVCWCSSICSGTVQLKLTIAKMV